jgi:hypothetical protein
MAGSIFQGFGFCLKRINFIPIDDFFGEGPRADQVSKMTDISGKRPHTKGDQKARGPISDCHVLNNDDDGE